MSRRFWAPGRVNLIGEFTDLAGGVALPAALDLGITLDCEPAQRIELRSHTLQESVSVASDGSGDVSGFGRYVGGIAAELALLGRPPVGLRGELRSTLPVGSGLSSSAALEIVVAIALCAVAEFELEPLELALAAQRAVHRAVGVPSGILDEAACLFGREGHAVLFDFTSLEHELVPLPPGVGLVIADSGVSRRLEHSGYATRRRELEEGVQGRVRHVETENVRVRGVVDAFRAGDLVRVGELFREGHESLRDDFEVSTPELDRLVEAAYENGALAARMTGGGFGGSIVALVDAGDGSAFAERMPARAWVSAASGGARELA
ncbi:MAG: galactokinase [Gaiellaceae bacterium]|nr:galactokinase [Gaiellaceae bacterium]